MSMQDPHSRGRAAPPAAAHHTIRLEMLFTLIMAVAAVGTAWAGFESSQWSRRQTASTTEAAAIRLQATREFDRADQQHNLDELLFTQWLNAIDIEMQADPSAAPITDYTPREKAISNFLLARFRPEFQPAMRAWLATHPFREADAPATPFAMPEYRLAAQTKADGLAATAEQRTVQARHAAARASNYTLTGLLFALAVFFSAIGNKASEGFNKRFLLGLSGVTLLGTLSVLAISPIVL